MKSQARLRGAIEFLIFYTLLVILWGAWVRISHSGDGCGDSWPLCDGQLIPKAAEKKTWVEFSHRLTSGLFGIYVLVGFIWVRRILTKGHPARLWAGAALILTVTEALLGAKLVLFGLVGSNDSFFRLFAMALHFINSACLTGSIVLWYLSLDPLVKQRTQAAWGSVSPTLMLWLKRLLIGALLIMGVTGTVAALSTTLFPSASVTEGLRQDLHEDSHFLLRWRLYHPLLGLLVSALGALIFLSVGGSLPKAEKLQKWRSYRLAALFLVTGVIGVITLFLLSPVVMKVVHLSIAYFLWIAIVAWVHGLSWQFDPQKEPKYILFFDGVCHLCHSTVKSFITLDGRRAVTFSPLQGELAKATLPEQLRVDLKSLAFSHDGKLLQKSAAVLALLRQGPWEIRLLGILGWFIPTPLRNLIYDLVAQNRYSWFGKKDVCELPSAEDALDLAQLRN